MPTYTSTGLVIGRTNLGEADRIIRLLTKEHGKIGAVARGVRKHKSRNAGHLEPFGEVELMLAKGRGSLDVITQARSLWYPHHLAESYQALGLAFMASTMVDRLVEEGQPQPELYSALRELLAAADLEAGALPELWFKLRFLHIMGYRPELGGCINCGLSDATATYSFDAERGGIVDRACAPSTARPMSAVIIKLWRFLSDHSYGLATRIDNGEDLAKESLPICDDFYEFHLGRRFLPSVQ